MGEILNTAQKEGIIGQETKSLLERAFTLLDAGKYDTEFHKEFGELLQQLIVCDTRYAREIPKRLPEAGEENPDFSRLIAFIRQELGMEYDKNLDSGISETNGEQEKYEPSLETELYYREIYNEHKRKYTWEEQNELYNTLLTHLRSQDRSKEWYQQLHDLLVKIVPLQSYNPNAINKRYDPEHPDNSDIPSLIHYIQGELDQLGPDVEFYAISGGRGEKNGKRVIDVSASPYFKHQEELTSTNGWLDPEGKFYNVPNIGEHAEWALSYVFDRSGHKDSGGETTLKREGWKKLRANDWDSGTYLPAQMATVLIWAEQNGRHSLPTSITNELAKIKQQTSRENFFEDDEPNKFTFQPTEEHAALREHALIGKLAGVTEDFHEIGSYREAGFGKTVAGAAQEILNELNNPSTKENQSFVLAKKIGALTDVLSRDEERKQEYEDFKILVEEYLHMSRVDGTHMTREEQHDTIKQFRQTIENFSKE